jgi:hypothetical protein
MRIMPVALCYLSVSLMFTGCAKPHASTPPGPPPMPSCDISADGLYLYTYKAVGSDTGMVVTIMRKATFTVTAKGFPKDANLTYTWQAFPNVGTITGSGKQVVYDDRDIDVNKIYNNQIDLEVNVQSGQGIHVTCDFQVPLPPPVPTPPSQ